MKPAHHQVNVVRIEVVNAHPNADRLEIIPIYGYQAVVQKGQFKAGDLAYYVPPDSIVPDRPEYAFLWNNESFEGGTPERKRRISARKFRGAWSEGLLMPLHVGIDSYGLGADISDELGITHYQPPEPGQQTQPNEGQPKIRTWPRTFMGWYRLILSWFKGDRRESGISLPTYDVTAYKRFPGALHEGEQVLITEKIHGSNARFVYKKYFFGGHFFVGSRNLWKAPTSNCVWRRAAKDNPRIEEWCRRHPDHALYGEITPTQKGFDYGSGDKVKFFLFDVRLPNGKWMELLEYVFYVDGTFLLMDNFVPVLHYGPLCINEAMKMVSGSSAVKGADHVREGIVIRATPERQAPGVGRAQLKIVSNSFLEKQ